MDCCRLLGETILERTLRVTFGHPRHVWIQHLSQSYTHIHWSGLTSTASWCLDFASKLVLSSIPFFWRPARSKCPCSPQNVSVASLTGHLWREWASLLFAPDTGFLSSWLLAFWFWLWSVWHFPRPISLWFLSRVLCTWRINMSITGFFKLFHDGFYSFIFSHKFQTIFNRHFLSFRH